MNYYSRYPAHYLSKTVHLTMQQDGAYTRLLDWMYANERPIPDADKFKIARASKKSEKDDVILILDSFFFLGVSGWENKRVISEIQKASPKIEAAKNNGLRGGRPPKEKPIGFPENNPVGCVSETQLVISRKAPQSPITNTTAEARSTADAPQAPRRGSRLPKDWTPDAEQLAWARAERPSVNLATEAAKFRDYWIAKAGQQGVKLDWPATFRNWIRSVREEPPSAANGRPPIAQNFSAKTYTGTPDDELPSFLRTHQA